MRINTAIILFLLSIPYLAPGQKNDSIIRKVLELKLIEPEQQKDFGKHLERIRPEHKYYSSNVLFALMMVEKAKQIPYSNDVYFSTSYGKEKLNNEDQKKVNQELLDYLSKLKSGNYLTQKNYDKQVDYINKNLFTYKLELIVLVLQQQIHETEMQPDKLNNYADKLHQNKILNDQNYEKFKNDAQNQRITEFYQFITYLEKIQFFDLSNDLNTPPSEYLEKIYNQVSHILPELAFTNFHYKIELDSLSSDNEFKIYDALIGINVNGKEYKHKSFIDTIKREKGDIYAGMVDYNSFHEIFNKVLAEQQSPYRLHIIKPNNENGDYVSHQYFGVIALKKEQTKMFDTFEGYLTITSEEYKNAPTFAQIDEGIKAYKKIGLLSHLTDQQIKVAVEKGFQNEYKTWNDILGWFPSVIYSFDVELTNIDNPYEEFLKEFNLISHNAFNPTNIKDEFDVSKKESLLSFKFNGKMYTRKIKIQDDWMDETFITFINDILKENNINARFF